MSSNLVTAFHFSPINESISMFISDVVRVGSQFSDFFKTLEKNSEKGTVLLIVQLQLSDFLEFV